MNISENLRNTISKEYSSRIEEILEVIDLSKEYIVKKTKNLEEFKGMIRTKKMEGSDSVLDSDSFIINGNVVYYPEIKVTGELVVIIRRLVLQSPDNLTREENTILIYEKDRRLLQC